MAPTGLVKDVVNDLLLSTAVRMAETTGNPGRNEASLGQIAQRLGELGELHLLRSLNSHRQRMQTCLKMAESS